MMNSQQASKTQYSIINALLILIVFITACRQPLPKSSLQEVMKNGKWIDLTYSFSSETIYWPNNPTGFKLDTQFNGITPAGFYYSSNAYSTPEHGGTHLDAPVHFAKGKWSVDQVPVSQLAGEAVVVDVSDKTKDNPDYQATQADVEAWEKVNGKIPDDAIVLFKTGWGKFYPDPVKYIGTAEKGEGAVAKLHFPSVHPDLAAWLLANRKIKALGVDTPSVDYGQSKDFKTHQLLYAQNIPGFENIANMEQLPAKGAWVIALPMKIKDGTGAPLRIVAWVRY
jgi:kynurenine formamidase